jgi:hypothetical protein
MAIFKKKRTDTQRDLPRTKKGGTIELKDSTEEEPTTTSFFKRAIFLSKFQRVESKDSADSRTSGETFNGSLYEPPKGFIKDTAGSFLHSPVVGDHKLTVKRSSILLNPTSDQKQTFHKLDVDSFDDDMSIDAETGSVSYAYEPPESLNPAHEEGASVNVLAREEPYVLRASTSFENMEGNKDTSFDLKVTGVSPSIGEFHQFVFDKKFSKIDGVSLEKSDSGVGDSHIFRMAAAATLSITKAGCTPNTNDKVKTSSVRTSSAKRHYSKSPCIDVTCATTQGIESADLIGMKRPLKVNRSSIKAESVIDAFDIRASSTHELTPPRRLEKSFLSPDDDVFLTSHFGRSGLRQDAFASPSAFERYGSEEFSDIGEFMNDFNFIKTLKNSTAEKCTLVPLRKPTFDAPSPERSTDEFMTGFGSSDKFDLMLDNIKPVKTVTSPVRQSKNNQDHFGNYMKSGLFDSKSDGGTLELSKSGSGRSVFSGSDRSVVSTGAFLHRPGAEHLHRSLINSPIHVRTRPFTKNVATNSSENVSRTTASESALTFKPKQVHDTIHHPRFDNHHSIQTASFLSTKSLQRVDASEKPHPRFDGLYSPSFSATSNANATITSQKVNNRTESVPMDDDPFHIGTENEPPDSAWDFNRHTFEKKSLQHSNDALIDSIRRARDKRDQEPDEVSRKPDPSPTNSRLDIRQSASDSALEVRRSKPAHHRKNFKATYSPTDIKQSCSDSFRYEVNSQAGSYGRLSKAPSAVPANAILGSMLFRQMDSVASLASKDRSAIRPATSREVQRVPSTVEADNASSSCSSVTEAASAFYTTNFQQWKHQASSALNHYNNIKKRIPNNTHRTSKENSSNDERLQRAIQRPPGRPTWLDRVEEEHKNMFTANEPNNSEHSSRRRMFVGGALER